MYRKELTKEDEENIDLIINPYPRVTEDILNGIEDAKDPVERNRLVEELGLVLSDAGASRNPMVQTKFPRVVSLLKEEELYKSAAIALSDACRHVDVVQDIFRKLDVFEMMRFDEENYKFTMSLVFAMCLGNRENHSYFMEWLYVEERDADSEYIKMLNESRE
jgi:hypothetical protein